MVLSGYSGFSTAKTDRHDIAEILLKVALKHQKSNQNKIFSFMNEPFGNNGSSCISDMVGCDG